MGTTTFAKDNLTPGETILHAGRFHLFRVRLSKGIFLFFLPLCLLEILWFGWDVVSYHLSHPDSYLSSHAPSFLAIAAGVCTLFCVWLEYRWEYNKAHKTEFVLTNQRLIAKWGFLRTVTREIQLDKIESVNYGQSLFERWYGVGRLTVRGSGGGKVGKFKYLLDALEFRKRFLAQIDRVNT
jgi:hypothetical protein